MKNCVIWTRVSTKRQEDNGGSLDDQRCKCEAFAKQNGYKIKDILAEHTSPPKLLVLY